MGSWQTEAGLAARRRVGDVSRQAILVELARAEEARELAPTWRELAVRIDRALFTTHYHVGLLAEAGLVEYVRCSSRTLRLTDAGRARVAG